MSESETNRKWNTIKGTVLLMAFALIACVITKYLLLCALKIAHFFHHGWPSTRLATIFWACLQAALICSCGASCACMELTINCRFQRLWNSSFQLFQCFRQRHVSNALIPCCLHTKHAEGMSLRYDAICSYTLIVAEIFAFGIICLGYVIKAEWIKEILDIIP